MGLFQTVLLGLLQGLTEFLPISSSGHLVLLQHLLGVNPPGLGLELALHAGTLLAVIAVFWSDLGMLLHAVRSARSQVGTAERSLLLAVILGTVATGVLALLLRGLLETAYDSLQLVAIGFLMSTAALWLMSVSGRGRRTRVGTVSAVVIGLVQGVATWPGLSRSGSTIAAGMLLGLDRELAARFSFLLSVPTIALASLVQFASAPSPALPALSLVLGLAVSALSGFCALRWLLRLLERGTLAWFGLYTLSLGLLILVHLR